MLRSNLLLPSSTQATFLYAHGLIVRAEANSLDAHYSYLHYPQTIKDYVYVQTSQNADDSTAITMC